jgi:hypothetical protein
MVTDTSTGTADSPAATTTGRLPDFLVIGAAKSGTTTLYAYLERHPQVHLPPAKEPEFFARDENFAQWYRSLFDGARPDQVCGEASTIYTRFPQFPQAAPRIAEAVPGARLIYLMRHPVSRAYSHFVQIVKTEQNLGRRTDVGECFEDHLQGDSVCVDSSDYMLQIEQYLRHYPREAFLFLLMDDLILRPHETLGQVCRFIGVDESVDLAGPGAIAANRAVDHEEQYVRTQTMGPLRKIPGFEGLRRIVPRSIKDGFYRAVRRSPYGRWKHGRYTVPPMRPETRQQLLDRFREPNRKLADFLDRNLSHWDK